MAFSCGFYNSLNGDRKYNARQVSELFDGIIRDGVYASVGDKLTVKQGTGMQIIVGTGRAWFNHSWSLVDAEYPLTVDQSDLILDRIDAVVLEVNESTEVRNNSIKMVKGVAASSPQKPTMTDTEFVHQYPLAYITVKKGATAITTADIEINVGKDNCPYVTSILEAVSIEELYAQWEAQFKGWEEGQKTQFEEWFGEIKGQLSEDAAGNLQIQVNDVKSRVDNEGVQIYTHSKSGTVHEFTGEGPNGRALMTDNVATGDTFTVNGSPVTAYMGSEEAVSSMAGSEWSGKWVTFVFDGDTINFKGGGGKVTVTGLSAGKVLKGTTVTVKQGSKTITSVSGTATQEYVYGFFYVRNHRYGGNTFSALPKGWNNIVPAGTYRAVYTTKVLRSGVSAWITINGATAVNDQQYTFADGKCAIGMRDSQSSGDIEGACAAAALYLIKVI